MAAALPVLVLVLYAALAAVTVAGQKVRVQDAAREAARAAARGDLAAAHALAGQAAPGGAQIAVSRAGETVTATVRVQVHPAGGWLPALTVSATAVAAAEPDQGGIPP